MGDSRHADVNGRLEERDFGPAPMGLVLKLAAGGRRVCDSFRPLPAADDAEAWQEAYRRRKEFERLIEADRDWPEAVKSGVAILSPLVAATVSVLIGGK